MSNEVDRAQQINEEFLVDALADHKRRRCTGENRMTCIDCKEPIPEARRKVVQGCKRCVHCQKLHENWRAL